MYRWFNNKCLLINKKYEKKCPDCSFIHDYISTLLSNSDITEEIISNRLLCVTDNNEIRNKPTNYIIDEIQVEIPLNLSN